MEITLIICRTVVIVTAMLLTVRLVDYTFHFVSYLLTRSSDCYKVGEQDSDDQTAGE